MPRGRVTTGGKTTSRAQTRAYNTGKARTAKPVKRKGSKASVSQRGRKVQ